VKGNGGIPGIDGMTVDDLPGYLKQHWLEIREQLLSGAYQPQPYVGWKSRSRTEACGNLAFLGAWIE
jgi:retron-type reverse transcriptase